MKSEPINQDRILFPNILKKRPQNSHKKSVGKVLVVAGSKNMTGAAALTCQAAMRAGAGYVTLAFPEKLANVYREVLLEVTTLPCVQTSEGTLCVEALKTLEDNVKQFDVVALGPGLSENEETQKFVREFVKKVKGPIVIDADGLNAFVGHMDILKKRVSKTIITPHPGEMAKLAGLNVNDVQNDRVKIAQKFSKEWGVILVLKGYNTIIADENGNSIINKTGGPALSTAGTGDVLLGTIAALWADNIRKPLEATATAVYLHGFAGDVAAEKLGEKSVIASDVVEILPEVIKIAQEKC